MKKPVLFALALAVGGFAAQPVVAQQIKPVVLRFAADFPPPPHPAGLAMQYFAKLAAQTPPPPQEQLLTEIRDILKEKA